MSDTRSPPVEPQTRRILHVTADPDRERATANALESETGCPVVTVATGAEGLDHVDRGDICCVLSDEALPDMASLALLEAIRECDPSLPFVLLVDDPASDVVTEALAAGVTDVRSTADPSQTELLARSLTAALDGDRPVATAETANARKFRAVFEEAFDAMVLANDDAEYVAVNDAACELFGLSESELLGRTVAEFAADGFDFEAAWESFQASDRDRGLFPLVRPDGTERLVEFAATPAIVPGLHLSILRDVTETRRLERELDEMLGRITDAFYALDSEWRFTYVNDRAAAILDQSAERLVGSRIWDVFPENDIAHMREQFTLATETQQPVEFDLHCDHFDTWVDIHAYPSQSGLSVYFRDISEKMARDRQLRESESRLSIALSAANAGVWEWDVQTDEVVWHESCELLFGLKPGTFEGTYEAFTKRVHPNDLPDVEDALTDALENGERFQAEYRIFRDDGTERWVDAWGELFTDDAGQPTKFVGVDVDVTERKEREQHLRVFDRVLRHNIRNDLNVISSYAELIGAEASGDIAEYSRRILGQSEKLLTTSDKERAITETLTTPPRLGRVDIATSIDRAVERAHDRYPDASIHVERPAAVTALATDRFGEALTELVENALVHTDRETPTVDISVVRTDERVLVHVADDGPTISDMNVAVLTGDREIDPVYHGSGLGLWVVNWILRRSGGHLSFDENEPRGNVVTLSLGRPTPLTDESTERQGGDSEQIHSEDD